MWCGDRLLRRLRTVSCMEKCIVSGLVPTFVVVKVVVLNFVVGHVRLDSVVGQIRFAGDCHRGFVRLVGKFVSEGYFGRRLCCRLASSMGSVRCRLNSSKVFTCIASGLQKFDADGCRLLIGFLPRLQGTVGRHSGNVVVGEVGRSTRSYSSVFVHRLKALGRTRGSVEGGLIGPFSYFSSNVGFVISLPVLLLR